MALEKVERGSGSLIGSGIASIQKSTAPEVNFGLAKHSNLLQICSMLGHSLMLADAAGSYG